MQLGVGLHAGTALLQIYGEIGIQPLVRTLARIKNIVGESELEQEALTEEKRKLEADFDIFKILLFN